MQSVKYEPAVKSRADFGKMVDGFLESEDHTFFAPPDADWGTKVSGDYCGRMIEEFSAAYSPNLTTTQNYYSTKQ